MNFKDILSGENLNLINTLAGGVVQTTVNVEQAENEIIINVSAPTVSGELYNILVNQNRLVVYALLQDQSLEGQRGLPLFNQMFEIPYFVDVNQIMAEYVDGKLQIIMPFKDKDKIKPRKIEIRNLS